MVNPSIKHQQELMFFKVILTDSWLSLQDKIQSKCHKCHKIQSKSLQWDKQDTAKGRAGQMMQDLKSSLQGWVSVQLPLSLGKDEDQTFHADKYTLILCD